MKAFMMVGAPGAGKSTFAKSVKKDNPGAVIICGDEIRKHLYGDANIQGNWVEIHDEIVNRLEDNAGNVIIMDGTHYKASYRKETLSLLQSYGYTDIEAIVVNPPLATCLAQNASRSRNVPEYVIERMHSSLQSSLKGIDREGFSVIKYVHKQQKP